MTRTKRRWGVVFGFALVAACGGGSDGETEATTEALTEATTEALTEATTEATMEATEGTAAPTTGGDGGPNVRELCERSLENTREYLCGCDADEVACYAEHELPAPSSTCECEVFAKYDNAGIYDCYLPHQDQLVACLEPLACSLGETAIACYMTYADAVADCGFLAGSAEVSAVCNGGTDSFQCGSGEYVFKVNVCDGTDHCKDGSDEASC